MTNDQAAAAVADLSSRTFGNNGRLAAGKTRFTGYARENFRTVRDRKETLMYIGGGLLLLIVIIILILLVLRR